jgi:hypothetical protein
VPAVEAVWLALAGSRDRVSWRFAIQLNPCLQRRTEPGESGSPESGDSTSPNHGNDVSPPVIGDAGKIRLVISIDAGELG